MNDALPAPLTPPDCDLRAYDWFPLQHKRLRQSAFWLRASDTACRISVELWAESYQQVPAASLPDDDVQLSEWAGYGRRDLAAWLAVKDEVMSAWVKCSDGRWYHPTLAEVACEAWIKRQAELGRREGERTRKEAYRRTKREGRPTGQTEVSHGTDGGCPPDVTREIALTETETERLYSVPNGTGVAAPGDDLNAEAWRRGTAVLEKSGGLTVAKSRTFFGKLLKDNPGLTARDLLPSVITAEANGTQDPKAYLTAAAKGLANRRGGRPAGPSPQTWDDEVWRTACENFRADGSWSPDMGPTPGSAGCMAPAAVLDEFGWSAAA